MDFEMSSWVYYLLLVALLLVPSLALFHMSGQQYKGRARLVWLLIIIFLPFFGGVLYFLIGKRYKRQNPE